MTLFGSLCCGQLKAQQNIYSLPAKQIHPLPSALLKWQNPQGTGNYFEEIAPTPVGYLIWSQFPIKIYFERNPKQARLIENVAKAIAEWNEILPLKVISELEPADIIITPAVPKISGKIDRATGLFDLGKAKAGVTSYEFYLSKDKPPILSHRMKITINPGQSDDAILAAARHELGHALGIWGHSRAASDSMYDSQTRDLAAISARDLNTLKIIYQQPTQLGWSLIEIEADIQAQLSHFKKS